MKRTEPQSARSLRKQHDTCGVRFFFEDTPEALDSALLTKLLSELLESAPVKDKVSSNEFSRGRTRVLRIENEPAFRVRLFRRGGLLARINHSTFLRSGSPSRVEQELRVLALLEAHAVPIARPVAGYVQYLAAGLLYRCILVTQELVAARNLLHVWRDGHAAIESQAFEVGVLCARLDRLGVWHRDLYPGNVLLDGHDVLRLIDFDKASLFALPQRKGVQAYYLARWERGCEKYLPAEAALLAIRGFRRGFLKTETIGSRG